MKTVLNYIEMLRPRQWVKNVFVFAGLIFSRHFYYGESITTAIAAFVVFCALSSSVYILNDVLDYEEDKVHPTKRDRPIAAGAIPRTTAVVLSFIIGIVALYGAHFINARFLYICLLYAVMMILYSVAVKHIIILDVLFVAVGYVLRAIAGAVAISVEISAWLLLCTLLFALFLVVSKRRTEIVLLGDDALRHRKTLDQYSVTMLDQMIAIVTSACIVSYCLYTLAPETVAKFNTRNLIFTVPFVVYGIFRYLYITYKRTEAAVPEQALLTDAPLLVCFILWVVVCVVILVNTSPGV
jgi:4-hydroxybenzoate polyprenyltransferase